MILFSHPTGNENVRNALAALYRYQLLDRFVTSIAAFNDNIWGKAGNTKWGNQLNRRRFSEDLCSLTVQSPLNEFIRLLSLKFGLSSLTSHGRGKFCVDRIYEHVDRITANLVRRRSAELRGVYAYEDGALHTFKAAKDFQLSCLYDLPIGYWRTARRIQSEEAEVHPEWACTLPALDDSEEKLQRKDQEIKLADHIFVASEFTRKTLDSVPFPIPEISVIPYGSPQAISKKELDKSLKEASRRNKLKVLFVGGLSQRKGLSYLLEAIEATTTISELTLIGRKPKGVCRPLESALLKHRWIDSLPHEKVLEEMRQQDVLVFPSLFEGFGLVVTEALSQGIPVITTPNTCGPDVLTEGKDGFIVPIRDAEAIAEKLVLLNNDRDRLISMRENAVHKAIGSNWNRYQERLASKITKLI